MNCFLVVLLLNSFFLLWILHKQKQLINSGRVRERGSITRNEQTFLHFQDFYSQKWGDTIGLPLVQFAFANALCNGVHIATWHWAFAICMMLVLMMFMIAACTDNEHKPDYGADEKGFTDAGVIHLFYLGINMFVISIAVCLASDGQISGLPLYCITAGGIFYGITQMLDFRAGHYAQGA